MAFGLLVWFLVVSVGAHDTVEMVQIKVSGGEIPQKLSGETETATQMLIHEVVGAAEERIRNGADRSTVAKKAAHAAADAVKQLDALAGQLADGVVDDEISVAQEVVAELYAEERDPDVGQEKGPTSSVTGGGQGNTDDEQSTLVPLDRSKMPIVVISRRKSFTEEEPLKAYWKIFEKTAAYLMKEMDIQAAIQVLEEDPNFYQDIQVFNGKEAFMDHVNMSNQKTRELLGSWGMQMMMAGPMQDPPTFFTGVVHGGWDEETNAETANFKALFKPIEALYGYIEKDWACNKNSKGAPVIVSSRRKVAPGKMTSLVNDLNDMTAWYKANLPGVGILAITAGQDPDDQDFVQDLQIFGDFQAFVDHMCGDFPWPTASFCNRKDVDCQEKNSVVCGEKLDKWMTNYDMSVPFEGQVFAPRDKLPLIMQATEGMGANFVGYALEDAKGSGPDFANAGSCAACSIAGKCGGY